MDFVPIACSLQNGKIEHRYLWGAAQDELLAMDDCWALRDHLNTVRKVVDAKGYVVSSLEYNAFGALVSATGEMPLFRYTGKLFDDDTALQWNVNRWYDSSVGRWISEDPIGFNGKDANLFRYVNNNATSNTDPLGLLTHKQIEDCCEKTNPGGASMGRMICCCHQPTTCNYAEDSVIEGAYPNVDFTPITLEIVRLCSGVHEAAHLDYYNDNGFNCEGEGTTAEHPMTERERHCSEATAYQAEADCLEDQLNCICYGDLTCETAVNAVLEDVRKRRDNEKENCEN